MTDVRNNPEFIQRFKVLHEIVEKKASEFCEQAKETNVDYFLFVTEHRPDALSAFASTTEGADLAESLLFWLLAYAKEKKISLDETYRSVKEQLGL